MEIKKILGYYWPHIKKYKWSSIALFSLYALGTIGFKVAAPIFYKNIIDIVTTNTAPALLLSTLFTIVLVYVLVQLASQLAWSIGNYLLTYIQSNVLRDITNDTFQRLQQHSHGFFNDRFIGSLVAKSKRYVDSFEVIHDMVAFRIFLDGVSLVGAVAVMTWFSPILGAVFVVWVTFFTIVTIWMIKKKMVLDLAYAERKSRTTGAFSDIFTNILNLKMFSAGPMENRSFGVITQKEEEKRRKTWYFHNHQLIFQGMATVLFKTGGLSVAILLWSKGSITAGTIVLIYTYMKEVSNIVWGLGRSMSRTVQAFTDAQEMIDIFETPIDVQDIAKPEKCTIKGGTIEIKNMSFSYNAKDSKGESIFKDFSLSVMSGEKIGLVGHSGSGKTTITKLLLRFMDVDSGEILIDGQNIAKIRQDDLRRNISYVPQDPILFHRSLRENIAYGKSDATEAEIVDAAKAANAHEFITSLPEGYDTLVGERGIKLSGGERQRVAIARAMLKDAPILILDEATSALDSISERHIQQAFERLMVGRTTLAIAHRLSTIQKMDRIVVFSKGTIVEQGTHVGLTQNNGTYAELWKEQSSGFIE